MAPFCSSLSSSFPHLLPGGGSGGGGRAGTLTPAAWYPPPEGLSGRRWRVICSGGGGGSPLTRTTFCRIRGYLLCFSLKRFEGAPLSRGIGLRGEESEKQCISVLRTEVGRPWRLHLRSFSSSVAGGGPGITVGCSQRICHINGRGGAPSLLGCPPSRVRGGSPEGVQRICSFRFRHRRKLLNCFGEWSFVRCIYSAVLRP